MGNMLQYAGRTGNRNRSKNWSKVQRIGNPHKSIYNVNTSVIVIKDSKVLQKTAFLVTTRAV